jgi:hypothetical protein
MFVYRDDSRNLIVYHYQPLQDAQGRVHIVGRVEGKPFDGLFEIKDSEIETIRCAVEFVKTQRG